MSATKDYLEWLIEKYGRPDEDMDDMLERLGDEASSFGWWKEFVEDNIADNVRGARAKKRPPRWDAFLSYATEQKDAVAEPLAKRLKKLGLKVWYDAQEYPDAFRVRVYRILSEGIAYSQVGVILVSPEYASKAWTMLEYRGLRLGGVSTLFFVLHGVGFETLGSLDPDLPTHLEKGEGGVASTKDHSLDEVARQITDFAMSRAKPRNSNRVQGSVDDVRHH